MSSPEGEGLLRPNGKAPVPRTAKQVIDQAIKDNRGNGNLIFGLLTGFAIAGVVALIWGMVNGEGAVALAGGISNVMLWPAVYHARQIRRENIALRLLEAPLSKAESSKEASDALREFFVETFLSRRPNPRD